MSETRGTLTLTGGRELENNLKKLEKKTQEKVLKRSVRVGGNVFLKAIRREAPKETGLLRKQTKLSVKVLRKSGQVSGLVRIKGKKVGNRNPRFYQHLVVGGTTPHPIPGPVAFGGNVYAGVNHPGSQQNHYVDRGFDSSVAKANEMLFREYRRMLIENL